MFSCVGVEIMESGWWCARCAVLRSGRLNVADVGDGWRLAERWLACGRLGGGGAGAPGCRTLLDRAGAADSIDDLGGASSSLGVGACSILLSILA